MTGEVLRILLLVLQLGFLALLYLILFGFARSLLRDLRSAEVTQMASQSGIGRLSVVESPDDEPALGSAIALGPINSIGRNVNSTIFIDDDFVSGDATRCSPSAGGAGSSRTRAAPTGRTSTAIASTGRWRSRFGDELTIGRVRMRLER